ncbi:MAG: Na+/H+ antiporter subunit E [Alphaproteobacteria bacterium]|nr:Na+/H+ antiporter subunit E [Alphaproteobacteria bacterium]
MRHTLALAGVLALTWLLWSGHTGALLLGLGLLSVAATAALARRMGLVDGEGVPLAVVRPGLITYLPWLLWQVVLSSIDVGRRVWARDPGLAPRMLHVTPTQATLTGRVLYANSITLTPGTISVMMEDDDILVHALHAEAADGLASGDMDRRVTALEGPA